MSIILGSDHAGFKTKEKIKKFLMMKHISFEDVGTHDENSVDYPDFAFKVGKKVVKTKSKGILVCGSGTGMVMAANRIKGVRAALAYDDYSAKMARTDNDANILCLRGRKFPITTVKKIITTWLKTEFSNEDRHKKRIKKLDRLIK